MAIVGAKIVNAKALEQAILKAFEVWTEEDINKKHWDDQFGDQKWDWTFKGNNDVTVRENTEEVTTPRDIYDLGNLYESGVKSYKYSSSPDGAEANWHWDAKNSKGKEYASAVHDGTKFMDGRPFTQDIAIPSSFFLKDPGKDLVARVQSALDGLSK